MRRLLCRMTFFLSIVALNVSLWQLPCLAKDIKVELVWKLGGAGWVDLQVADGEYELQSGPLSSHLSAGADVQLGWGGWTPVIRVNHEDFQLLPNNALDLMPQAQGSVQVKTADGTHAVYRGGLSVTWEGDRWRLINKVDGKDYLKGVVPVEMSNQWAANGLAALQAQSVAARTYMVKHTQNGQTITDSPDIDQAYGGQDVEGAASQAVDMTAGEVLVDSHSGTPIDALYSSHSGGYTEDPQNVWGNIDIHYSAHPDPYSEGMGGAQDHWRFLIAAPALGDAFDLGPVRKVELDKFPSGRVKKVRMEDWNGRVQTVSGGAFVQAFYPFGQPISKDSFLGKLFNVSFVRTAPPLNRLRPGVLPWLPGGMNVQFTGPTAGPRLNRLISSAQGVSFQTQPYGVFVFDGRGWGHGVGMSQWGAYRMAQMGFSYREILAFYYDNAVLVHR